MRSARPFIASIFVALALIAATVVALRVTPDGFSFDAWPQKSSGDPAARPLRVRLPDPPAPAPVVVSAKPQPRMTKPTAPRAVPVRTPVAPRPLRAVAQPAPAPAEHGDAPTTSNQVPPASAQPAPAPAPAQHAAPAPAAGAQQPLSDAQAQPSREHARAGDICPEPVVKAALQQLAQPPAVIDGPPQQ